MSQRSTCVRFAMGLIIAAALIQSCSSRSNAQELRSLGLLDVTDEPYFADPTGETDSTDALSRAMAYGRAHRLVVFLPSGTYTISDTLQAGLTPRLGNEDDVWKQGRYWPLMMMGSRVGDRPKIYLRPDSDGFGNSDSPKLVVYYHDGDPQDPPNQPESAPGFINNKFVGIDIEIGEGNPGAIGIRMRGAQGTVIEDSLIDVTHGLIGIEGACGSGGGFTNVTVIGGEIGLDASASQPAPTITGVALIGQRKTAIVYRGRQTLTATGVVIVTRSTGPAVLAEDMWTSIVSSVDAGPGRPTQVAAWNGPICFVDSEVSFEGEPGVAFESNCGVYLNNVYVRNAKTLVKHEDGGSIAGRVGRWARIQEYARGYNMRQFAGYQYESPVYVDGIRMDGIANVVATTGPPRDLQSSHVWNERFPSWEDEDAVNVREAPYYARGDGFTDDTKALQNAIDENELVFLPKGQYRIRKTIELRENTKLLGVAPHLSAIVVRDGEYFFSDPTHPQPVLRSPNDADATTLISYVGTWPRGEGAYNLLWRSGRNSMIRDWIILYEGGMNLPIRHHPSVIVTGHGGGRWYNYYDETYNREYAPSYRHLLIDGTYQPFTIYQCNPEHARSQTNLEIRNSANVSLHGVKGEGNYPIVSVRHSNNIQIFGYGGNAPPWPGTSLFVVEDSDNIVIASIFDSVRLADEGDLEFFAGPGVEPNRWHALVDSFSNGDEFRTPTLERPVLYRRGSPGL